LHEAGVSQAVATCGTALADGHVRLLTNFARRIVLAYDADSAGQAAAERFYEWERKFEVDIVVAALSPQADPAEMAQRDPEALRAAVSGAQPFLAFRLARVLARADLRTPEGRARAAAAGMAVVSEHPNELVKDQYLMQVADRCQMDPVALRSGAWRSWVTPSRSRDGRPAQRAPAGNSGAGRGSLVTGTAGPELEALRLAVHRPETVANRLEAALFADELHLAVFQSLAAAVTLHDAIANADPEAADLLQRLAVEEAEEDPDDVMIRLIEESGKRVLRELEREARGSGSPDGAPTVAWIKLALEELRIPQTRGDAEARLVPWLVDRLEGVHG
jgi:DNA primase